MSVRTRCAAVVLWLAAGAAIFQATSTPPLVIAIKAGDRAAVQRLLKAGTAVDTPEADGTTALHWAVRADDEQTTRLLLRSGAKTNVANRHGVTPLSLAALNGNVAIVRALLEAGADANIRMAEEQTILMTAARAGNPDVVSALIDAGADVNAAERIAGETALMWAALENHSAAVARLAARGAAVDGRSKVTSFPRLRFGDGIVARPTVLPRGGWTPLMYAARENAIEAAAALADAGANLNLQDPDGTTALVFAIINGHYDLARVLLEKGADPNVADERGMAALYAAVDMSTLDITVGRPNPKPHANLDPPGLVKALLAHRANPNQRLRAEVLERVHNDGDPNLTEGATPLMRAAKDADVPVMRLLLDAGAEIDARAKNQKTALMFAAGRLAGFRGSPNRGSEVDAIAAVTLALDRGAAIDAADETGQTALHLSVAQAEDGIVRLLVARGASLQQKDLKGRTPLDVARAGRGASQSRIALLTELAASR